MTETVFALGAGQNLVGVDSTSTYPEAARAVPQVGYLRSLSAEGLLSLRPDLVLASSDAGPPAALAPLARSGVQLVRLTAGFSPEATVARIQQVADALGAEAEGRRLVGDFQARWEAARQRVAANKDARRVLFLLAHTGGAPQVAGRGTAADAMLSLAGATNAAANLDGYKPISAELFLHATPDALLITDQGLAALGGAEALWRSPGLSALPAARRPKLIRFDALYLLGFGPRLPEAVSDLATALGTVTIPRP